VRFPRWAHHLYALVTGYGWFTCLCGQEFGGHEATGEEVVRYNGDRFAICPTCAVRRYRQQGAPGVPARCSNGNELMRHDDAPARGHRGITRVSARA
jgi:hypothetical protein